MRTSLQKPEKDLSMTTRFPSGTASWRHAGLGAALALAAALPAHATENYAVRALLGAPGFELTTPAFPGWYGQAWYQRYDASSIRGDDGKVLTQTANTPLGPLELTVNGKITANVYVPRITYISEHVLNDGHLGFSATLPYVDQTNEVTLDPSLPAGLSQLQVDVTNALLKLQADPLNGTRRGQADLELEGFVDWQLEATRVIGGFTMDAPVGDYDKNRSVNPGAGNYWTVSPLLVVSKVWESGIEAGLRTTYSFNTVNKDTQVRSGQYLHMDWTALYHVNDLWRLGLQGYVLKQTTDDSGPGVAANGNKGQALSAGPALAYLSESGNWAVDVKWMQEFAVRNRPEGNMLWLRFNYRLQ
jgi:hypothetical protein